MAPTFAVMNSFPRRHIGRISTTPPHKNFHKTDGGVLGRPPRFPDNLTLSAVL
jgi:hypothetical protein